MKKKVLSVLMVFMMCLGLAGCGGGSNSTSDDISGKVSLNGSTSMEKFVNALSEGIKEKYPNLQLEAQFTGSCARLGGVALNTKREKLQFIEELQLTSTIYRIWCRSRSSCFKNNRYRRFFSCFNR